MANLLQNEMNLGEYTEKSSLSYVGWVEDLKVHLPLKCLKRDYTQHHIPRLTCSTRRLALGLYFFLRLDEFSFLFFLTHMRISVLAHL